VRRTILACAVSALLGAAVHRLASQYEKPERPGGPYSANLVDRLGAPLSARQGQLKLAFDPWTTYRILPRQTLPYLTIDADGFRVADPQPAGDRQTIVVLGGSAAFGQGLASDAETFAARLAQMRSTLHFVNAATVGFASGQELAQMVHYADRLRPSLYVVFDGWNDLRAQSDGAAAYGLGYNWEMAQQIEEQLRKAVHAAAAGHEAFRPSPDQVAAAYIENLDRMQAFARARGTEILFVFQPHLSAALDTQGRFADWRKKWYATAPRFDLEYDAVVAQAVRACTEHGWTHLDMSRALPSADFFIDPVHPNAAGHARIAEILAPIFSEASPTAGAARGGEPTPAPRG
jgi:lysophospholipase L1-like esterase